jgi:hypothetical protein
MTYQFDYAIYRDPKELESTGFMEIGPGKYSGKHWQPGFIFVWEDAFGMAEGVVAKHFSEYDHFEMNEIPKNVGRRIIADWRDAAKRLPGLTPTEGADLLDLKNVYRADLSENVAEHRDQIVTLLDRLADACENYYRESDWISILGM